MPLNAPEQPFAGTNSEVTETEGTSFADLFRAIANGKWFIFLSAAICIGASSFYLSVTKPIYEATGLVRIDPSRSGSLGLTDALMGGANDVIPTEIGILTSDQVALSTLETLTPEQFQAFAGFPKSKMVFSLEDAQHKPVSLSPAQASVVDQFKGALKAKQNEGTQLVAVSVQDHDPQRAALLVNRAVDAYMRINFNSRYSAVEQVQGWLAGQMETLRQRANNAQGKLAQFQENNNLVGTDPSNNTEVDRLNQLNQRVTEAEGDRIVKEAQLRAAKTGDATVLVSLVPDAHLQALQSTEATLYAQYTQLATKFGANYPPLVETKAQLTDLRKEISSSINVITAHLQADFNASQQAENMLRKDYEQELTRVYALNRKQADYAVLLAEGSSSRDLYNSLESRLQQATVNAGLDSINTVIVDRARTPLMPVAPKKMIILASALILGLAVGVGAALLKEATGGQIQTVLQAEAGTGLVTLVAVPHIPLIAKDVKRRQEVSTSPRLVTISDPTSRFAEAYRTLRNSILLSYLDHPPRLILVCSSLPSEGKTSTTANYAVALAQKGSRILVIDADLRLPWLHTRFGVPNEIGLSDWLTGSATSDDILTPLADLPNLHFIPAGRKIPFPSEALSSSKLESLLEHWKQEYDIVLLDSAPLLTVSDSLALARLADVTVLVARAGVTPLKALKRAKFVLLRVHARIAGVVLNDSNVEQDSGYYGKNNYGYYQ